MIQVIQLFVIVFLGLLASSLWRHFRYLSKWDHLPGHSSWTRLVKAGNVLNSLLNQRVSKMHFYPLPLLPDGDAECHTGNGKMGRTGHTRQCSPFSLLFHFLCAIPCPHAAAPFFPALYRERHILAHDLGLPCNSWKLGVPPCIRASHLVLELHGSPKLRARIQGCPTYLGFIKLSWFYRSQMRRWQERVPILGFRRRMFEQSQLHAGQLQEILRNLQVS